MKKKPSTFSGDNRELLHWFTMVRLITPLPIILAVLIPSFLGFGGAFYRPDVVVFWIIPFYLLLSVFLFFATRLEWDTKALLYSSLLVDVFAITAAVHFLGGTESPFTFLYILVIISASMISTRAVIGAGFASLFSFLALTVFEHSSLLPSLQLHDAFHGSEVITLSVLALLVTLVAFQSSYYITKTRKQEERIRKFKDDFMFKTIHDLKNPLTIVRYAAKELEPAVGGRRDSSHEHLLDMVQEAGVRMTNLVEDILEVGKSHQLELKLNLEGVRLPELIEHICEQMEGATDEKSVTIKHNPGDVPEVLADRVKLEEVLTNLIENAIKYNKEGGTVTITYDVKGDNVRTTVADTGIGIDEESRGKLFQPYFREQKDPEVAGTGLGLYIVKTLTEKMGGSVHLESEPGKGSKFFVDLPIYKNKE